MKQINTKQAGFTLVELLVVMLVLVALSSITLDFTQDFAFQGRYEVTKDRYDKIKRAIIGRPDVLINGQPDISGFVADMGRLPRNIQELLVQNYCMPDYRISDNRPDADIIGSYATKQEWCEGEYVATVEWVEQTAWVDPTATSLGYGWRGPYITAQKPDFQENALSDGWGSVAVAITDHNYGWRFVHKDSADSVIATINTNVASIGNAATLDIQSLAKDQAIGGSGYDEDYPVSQPTISQNDWLLSINKLNVNLKVNTFCKFSSKSSCLKSGGSWTACRYTETKCNTLAGSWNDTNPLTNASSDKGVCQLSEINCAKNDADKSGIWKACHYTAPTNCPTSVLGIDLNHLFNHQLACEKAGGSWLSSECRFTESIDCDATGGIPEFQSGSPDYYLCKACDVSTKTACEIGISGKWPADTTGQIECENKGGIWSVGVCSKPNTAISCDKAGGNWNGTNCVGYDLCSLSPSNCRDSGVGNKAIWRPSCLFYNTHNQSDISAPNNEPTCTINTGDWDTSDPMCSLDGNSSAEFCGRNNGEFQAIDLCLTIYYRQNNVLTKAYSQPYSVTLNGEKIMIPFLFNPSINIPMGLNAIAVYHDDDSDCTTEGILYSDSYTEPMPIQFTGNKEINIINW